MSKREYAKTQIHPPQEIQLDGVPDKQQFVIDGVEQKLQHRPNITEEAHHSRENSWEGSESQRELKRYTPIQLSCDNFAMSNQTRQRFA